MALFELVDHPAGPFALHRPEAQAVLEGGAAAINYPPSPELGADPDTDVRLDASLFGEYRIKDSIGINSTIRYNHNITDNAITPAAAGTAPDQLQWQEFEAYLGVRWFM